MPSPTYQAHRARSPCVDLAEARFGGHPFIHPERSTPWSALDGCGSTPPKARRAAFKVLTVTRKGAHRGEELAAKYGLAEQATWSGLVKRAEVRHDVAIYRASQAEKAKLEARGCVVQRIRNSTPR